MKFTFIDWTKTEFPVQRLCSVLEVSQSGYFAWKFRPACRRQRDDMVLLAHIRSANDGYRPDGGFDDGASVVGGMPPASRNHRAPTAGDTPASAAAFSLDKPAAIAARNRRLSSRRATGGRPGDHITPRKDRSERLFRVPITTSSAQVLRRSVEFTQYCSVDYQAELRRHGIAISMSGKGNCYDNAMVETFFKTIKSELVWRTIFYTREQAETAIARYIDGFYNAARRHSALDFISPVQFERLTAN